jgi:methionyl-tRNA formyltransferase
MRIGWIGQHREGLPALRALLERGIPVEAAISLRPAAAQRTSGRADYRPVCRRFGLRLYEVDSVNDITTIELLRHLDLDLVFVIGWTQLVRPDVLRLARVGMIGAHASLLPADRGRAPINWALIHGAAVTGNTLFWLTERADAGDIIDQTSIPIGPYDTCESLYRLVAASNREMILRALPLLLEGQRPGRPQVLTGAPPLPARRPEDGWLDWTRSSHDVYNFVRALTRPYPGAFTASDADGRFTIWRCALLPDAAGVRGAPGEALGPVISPSEQACGQLIACGEGAIVILEIERPDGDVIRGHALSDLRWTGHRLGTHMRDTDLLGTGTEGTVYGDRGSRTA